MLFICRIRENFCVIVSLQRHWVVGMVTRSACIEVLDKESRLSAVRCRLPGSGRSYQSLTVIGADQWRIATRSKTSRFRNVRNSLSLFITFNFSISHYSLIALHSQYYDSSSNQIWPRLAPRSPHSLARYARNCRAVFHSRQQRYLFWQISDKARFSRSY